MKFIYNTHLIIEKKKIIFQAALIKATFNAILFHHEALPRDEIMRSFRL